MDDDTAIPVDVEPMASRGPRYAPQAPPRERWGEELPVFCERCGYSFNGLTQNRCQACAVLHFACPECGHHQPINTLRPAFQRMLGRLRAQGLALIVLVKINFFFWCLLAWAAFGTELARHEIYSRYRGNTLLGPREFQDDLGLIMLTFSFLFAAIGRMLLLRWRQGVFIGLVIGLLAALAVTIGAYLQRVGYPEPRPSPLTGVFLQYLSCAVVGAGLGGACVWGVWMALTHAFLPKRTATALIEWQRGLSIQSFYDKNRPEPALSVTS